MYFVPREAAKSVQSPLHVAAVTRHSGKGWLLGTNGKLQPFHGSIFPQLPFPVSLSRWFIRWQPACDRARNVHPFSSLDPPSVLPRSYPFYRVFRLMGFKGTSSRNEKFDYDSAGYLLFAPSAPRPFRLSVARRAERKGCIGRTKREPQHRKGEKE